MRGSETSCSLLSQEVIIYLLLFALERGGKAWVSHDLSDVSPDVIDPQKSPSVMENGIFLPHAKSTGKKLKFLLPAQRLLLCHLNNTQPCIVSPKDSAGLPFVSTQRDTLI